MRGLPVLALGLSGFGSQLVSAFLLSDVKALGLSAGTQVGTPSESAFTQRWSTYNAPSYIAAVKPTTEQDVAKIVRIPSRRKGFIG
jgi:hypothetical protein